MNKQKPGRLRLAIGLFLLVIIALAFVGGSYLLVAVGVLTAFIFLVLVQSKFSIANERELIIREKSAQNAYSIFAPTIGIGAFLLLIPSYSGLAVFAKGEFTYLESLGLILAYLTLFLITLYALSYFFLNRQYGGGHEE